VSDGASESDINKHLARCDECRAKASCLDLPSQDDTLPDPASFSAGFQIGPFTIENRLNSGGMGHVYLAQNVGPKAVKFLKTSYSYGSSPQAARVRKEFVEQALQMSRVSSPHVANINSVWTFEAGTDPRQAQHYDPTKGLLDGFVPFVVMEFVDRGTLYDEIGEHARSNWKALKDLALQMVEGVRSIHARNVIHLDIKPANVLLAEDRLRDAGFTVKLTDFGVRSCTPVYAAPEVEKNQDPTYAADLYSLGATLFEMCTGKRYASLVHGKINRTKLKDVRKDLRRSPCGRLFEDITVKLLQENPNDRHQSAQEVYDELEKVRPPSRLWLWLFFVFTITFVGAGLRGAKKESLNRAQLTLPEPTDAALDVEQVSGDEDIAVKSQREERTCEAWESFKAGEALHDGMAPARTPGHQPDTGDRLGQTEHLQRARTLALAVMRSKGAAARIQYRLEREKAPMPPEGQITDETLKQEVFSWGQLNDVAVCLWIIGRASEYLGEHGVARHAYEQGTKLTYARVWDPETELFWSPSIKCADDFATLAEAYPEQDSGPRLALISNVLMWTGLFGALITLCYGVYRNRWWVVYRVTRPFAAKPRNAA
jgi:serine/threonine protein kinase